jgi:acyl-CoA synthetase (AMP-forming)/AMP-acid ligase II
VGVRVRDDKGRPCRNGEIGGIEVKGPNVFKGYWRMPEKTAEEFTTDLWFKTGDVGRVDDHGYVTIVGRSKDLIISGGYNVYPAEIEGYLNDIHPHPPRRLAPAPARRRRAGRRAAAHGGAVRARHRHAQPAAAGHHHGEQALAYRERILAALPAACDFEPLMTLYLTDNTPPDEIAAPRRPGVVAVKLYPAGATTNSDAGVTDIRKTYATLEAMQREACCCWCTAR